MEINNNDDDDDRLVTKVKSELKTKAPVLTLHGVTVVLRTQFILIKIIWLLIFTASLVLSIIILRNQITDFQNHETYIKIKLYRQQTPDYPSITICNRNPFNNDDATIKYIDRILDAYTSNSTQALVS